MREVNYPTQVALVITMDMRRQLREVINSKKEEGHIMSMSEYVRQAVRKSLIRDGIIK